jgi:hypothetical protein
MNIKSIAKLLIFLAFIPALCGPVYWVVHPEQGVELNVLAEFGRCHWPAQPCLLWEAAWYQNGTLADYISGMKAIGPSWLMP